MDRPSPRRSSALARFLRGASYPFRGLAFVLRHPSTWPSLVVPTLLAAAAFIGALFVAWHGVPWLLAQVWFPGDRHAVAGVAWYALVLVLRAVAFLVTGIVLYFSLGILAVPFNDWLSEKIEALLLGPRAQPSSWGAMLVDVGTSVVHSALSLGIYVAVMIALFGLELFPGLGSGVHLVLGSFVTSLFLARETMDGCLSRRRMSYAHKIRVLRTNLATVVGFGFVASVLLAVPLMNFVFMPLLVAGGTVMYCHLEREGAIPNRQGTGPFADPHRRAGPGQEPV